MIVVDTNVVAYLLIEGDYTPYARALYHRDPDWRIPGLWRYELMSVLSRYVRHGGMPLAAAQQIWATAQDLLHRGEAEASPAFALELAARHAISAYDAQFVALATQLGTVLFSQDRALLKALPELCRPLAAAA